MGMNSAIKTKWLEALRSGEYHQGKATLCLFSIESAPRHCCLGVLCEVLVQEQFPGVSLKRENCNRKFVFYNNEEDGCAYLPPPELMVELGIDSQESVDDLSKKGGENDARNSTKLWKMNDDEGKSFIEIADWIEGNL